MRLVCASAALGFVCTALCADAAGESGGFARVLADGGVEVETLPAVVSDQELYTRLLFRLRSFEPGDLKQWERTYPRAGEQPLQLGELYDVQGRAVSLVSPPGKTPNAATSDEPRWVCKLTLPDGASAALHVPVVPKAWEGRGDLDEPVRFQGVCVDARAESPRFVAARVEWFPEAGLDVGRLLLASRGFDVGLLDEVRHRRPFVSESVSLEARAFYACLEAVGRVPLAELEPAAKGVVKEVAEAWSLRLSEPGQRGAMARAVADAAEEGRSSVAPLFLQPELEKFPTPDRKSVV